MNKADDTIIRALDAWLLHDPATTIDVVTAWLESVNVEVVDPILEAEMIEE